MMQALYFVSKYNLGKAKSRRKRALKCLSLFFKCYNGMNKKAGIQFSHNITEQIGGQFQTRFTLLDLYEDTNTKTYIITKSVKL